MNLPDRVTLREVAPRDGFQSLERTLPTAAKLDIIRAAARAGVSEMETTSFVSPRAVPQLADAAALMAAVPREGIRHGAMVPNPVGARHAIAAGADRLVMVISASEAHNQRNVRQPITSSIAGLDPLFEAAAAAGIPVIGAVAVAFGCPYQGEVPEREVFNIVKAYHARGAKAVILADTTGMASPVRVDRMVREFRDRFPETDLILHLHNNRGAAMANLLAGLWAGVRTFDTALGGIGGCPFVPRAAGNLATEDVVFMLEDMQIDTGIDLAAAIDAARNLEKILGFTLPGQVMKSGPRHPDPAHGACPADQ